MPRHRFAARSAARTLPLSAALLGGSQLEPAEPDCDREAHRRPWQSGPTSRDLPRVRSTRRHSPRWTRPMLRSRDRTCRCDRRASQR